MINLLPDWEKLQLKRNAFYKKVLVILLFAIIAAAFLDLSLFVLARHLKSKTEASHLIVVQKEEQFRETNFADFKKVAAQLNQYLSVVQKTWQNQTSPSQLFEKLSRLTPAGLYFSSFAFDGAPAFKISIMGGAQSREDLFAFKNTLEQESQFKAVYFLPYSWIQAKEPDFTLQFSLKE